MTRFLIKLSFLCLGFSAMLMAEDKTDLLSAVKLHQYDRVKTILATAVDINKPDLKGYTPVFYASIKGYTDITDLLIATGADVNKAGRRGWTPLLGAALHGHNTIVNRLLDSGANIDHRNSEHMSALMLAVQKNQHETAQLLMQRGAQREFIEKTAAIKVKSLLAMAVQNNDLAMVELLLKAGIKPNTEAVVAMPLLFIAAAHPDSEMLNLLVGNGANLKQCDEAGNSLLHFAALKSVPAVLDVVLRKKPALASINAKGETALMLASRAGAVDNALRLLALAAPKQQQAALFVTLASGRRSMLEAMLAKGVDVNAVTAEGETTLMAAVQARHDHLLPILLEQGADLNARNSKGQTALMIAVTVQPIKLSTVRALISAGADRDIKDFRGNTALSLAQQMEERDQQLIELLAAL